MTKQNMIRGVLEEDPRAIERINNRGRVREIRVEVLFTEVRISFG